TQQSRIVAGRVGKGAFKALETDRATTIAGDVRMSEVLGDHVLRQGCPRHHRGRTVQASQHERSGLMPMPAQSSWHPALGSLPRAPVAPPRHGPPENPRAWYTAHAGHFPN